MLMKTTKYFNYRRLLSDRLEIKEEWIERVINNPMYTKKQKDGRIKRWGKIIEAGGKYLRVITLEDGQTVHNAFFDRSFNGEIKNEN